jgi:hypothetical protein
MTTFNELPQVFAALAATTGFTCDITHPQLTLKIEL